MLLKLLHFFSIYKNQRALENNLLLKNLDFLMKKNNYLTPFTITTNCEIHLIMKIKVFKIGTHVI